jgi:GNAT superfamily N-acetyltransferase
MPVRPARSTEADALASLGASTLQAAFERDVPREHLGPYLAASFTPEAAAADLRDPRVQMLVAEERGELVGYAKLHIGPAPDCVCGESSIELVRMYLAPAWYGRGIGDELMTHCFGVAHARDCDVVWLKVWDRNERARAFYQRWGFRAVGATFLRLVPELPESSLGMQIMSRTMDGSAYHRASPSLTR